MRELRGAGKGWGADEGDLCTKEIVNLESLRRFPSCCSVSLSLSLASKVYKPKFPSLSLSLSLGPPLSSYLICSFKNSRECSLMRLGATKEERGRICSLPLTSLQLIYLCIQIRRLSQEPLPHLNSFGKYKASCLCYTV